jgi:hypothetical protein
MRWTALLAVLALVAAGSATAIETFPITGASIGGAKLGWTRAHYQTVLGKPRRVDQLEGGLTRLAYPGRELEVYLQGGRGVAVATWNRHYRNSARLGPCAPLDAVLNAIIAGEKGYDVHWKRLLAGRDVQIYQHETLTYRVNKHTILAVALATKPYRLQVAGNTSDCG